MLALLVVMLSLLVVIVLLAAPLYRSASEGQEERLDNRPEDQRVELEAQRITKLNEIREAELDWRTGKLSEADWKDTDAKLRAEAAVILRELDAASAPKPA